MNLIKNLRSGGLLGQLTVLFLMPGMVLLPTVAYSNPSGGQVIKGSAEIVQDLEGALKILQSSDSAVIEWEDFSIDVGELTQFLQPGSDSATLNRVTSGAISQLMGDLKANGKVLVINPNGIVIGSEAVIDTAGFIASTLDVDDDEFMAGGDMVFKGDSEASVVNMGRISTPTGDVFLISRSVENKGEISAPNGTVGLAGGQEVLLLGVEDANGERIFVRPSGLGSVSNSGVIEAATAELKAKGGLFQTAVNNSGQVKANRVENRGGRIFLRAGSYSSGSMQRSGGGKVVNTGSLTAKAGVNGGDIVIDAGDADVQIGGLVDASGEVDGGKIEVIGNEIMIEADAEIVADGGQNGGDILIGADEPGGTEMIAMAQTANISASGGENGGNIGISSTGDLDLNGTLAASGQAGMGGSINATADSINIGSQAHIQAEGDWSGGVVQIGGGFQGNNDDLRNATSVYVEEGALIEVDGLGDSSYGGTAIVWADGDTTFSGSVSATGALTGGFVEVSGKSTLSFDGFVDVTASNGTAGTLLLDPTDVTIDDGTGGSIDSVALSDMLDLGNNIIITTAIGGGDAGDITVLNPIEWYAEDDMTTPGSLSLLADRHVFIRNHVRSAGEGNINIVAGWNGSTGLLGPPPVGNPTLGGFDMAAVLATMNDGNALNDAAGNGGGSVVIGATNTALTGRVTVANQVEVGSRFGDTGVAGHDLFMWGSNGGSERYVQLGFRDTGYELVNGTLNNGQYSEWWGSNGAADGSGGATTFGNIQGKDYIAQLGGTRYNGGSFDGAGSGADGNISVQLSGQLDMRSGDGNRSYVQIGHGGSAESGLESSRNNNATDTRTTRDGYVIDSYDNSRQFFSSTWRTNIEANPYDASDVANSRNYSVRGDITVHAAEDILLMAAPDFGGANNAANADASTGMTAQIGHGGSENHGSYHGNISVTADGAVSNAESTAARPEGIGIDLIGGRGTNRWAKIGHGSSGEGNARTILEQTRSGNIDVMASVGAIRLQGYNEPLNNGNNAWQYAEVQIGHGGSYSQVPAIPNSTSQRDRGTFKLPDGTILIGQIDTGGGNYVNATDDVADNSVFGDINVTAMGTYIDPRYVDATNPNAKIGISVQASNNLYAYGQIGHGGTNQRGLYNTGFHGDVIVNSDQGDIIFAGGQDRDSNRDWGYGRNHVMIGHGGRDVDGVKGGLVTVTAGQGAGADDGDIIFRAGKHYESPAQIGHGGYSGGGGIDSAAHAADINVTAYGSILFESGESGNTNAMLNNQNYANWWFDQAAANTNRNGYWQAQDRYVMIGHGGRDADGVMPFAQDITITSGTGDLMNADNDVSTGGITFISGNQDRDFAQIGHGGYSNGASDENGFTGNITINSNGGSVTFDGSIEGGTRYQRVNNGRSLDGATLATRTVTARDTGYESYIQIGHGGYASRGNHSGTLSINSYGAVDMIGSVNNPTTSQMFTTAGGDDLTAITGGVQAANSSNNFWISLSPKTDTGASSGNAFDVSIGAVNVKPGTLVIVLDDGTIITDLPDADNDERESNIVDQFGNDVGDINYEQGLVRFNAATIGSGSGVVQSVEYDSIQGYKERAYVQIGHGGYDADGPNNNLTLGNTGDINILAADDVRLHAGAFHRNYAQLGHGGYSNKGAHSGDITIDLAPGTLGGKLEVLAGVGGHRHYDYQSYGQLGHGGYDADGNHYGDITITNGMNATDGLGVFFKSGTNQDNYTQLGHGGRDSRSGVNSDSTGTGSFGMNGDINITTQGDIAFVAGTGIRNNDTWEDDFRLYTILGHGGWNADPEASNDTNYGKVSGLFSRTAVGDTNAGEAGIGDGNWGHFGDIVINAGGNITFAAGNTTALVDRLDSEGNPLTLPSDPNGFLVSHGDGIGRFHSATLGHGGLHTAGDHHGNIVVNSLAGSVSVLGGEATSDNDTRKTNYAVIGHNFTYQDGNPNGHLGRMDETISVYAAQDVNVIAGYGERNFAMIGLGGTEADGTFASDIQVYAGRDINLQGGLAQAREVFRNGEFQDMSGSNGGNSNDLSEFNIYYGTGNLGLLLMDEAAGTGGGQKTRLMNGNITPNSVSFQIDHATHTYVPGGTAHIKDDGAGNLIAQVDLANGSALTGATVGTIDYATGEITWDVAVIDNATDNPDMFVDYATTTEISRDAIWAYAQIGHGGYHATPSASLRPEGISVLGHTGDIDVRAGVDQNGDYLGTGIGSITALAGNDRRNHVQIGHGGTDSIAPTGGFYTGEINVQAADSIVFRGGEAIQDNYSVAWNYDPAGGSNDRASGVSGGTSNAGLNNQDYNFAMIGHGGYNSDANNGAEANGDPLSTAEGHNGTINVSTQTGDIDFQAGGTRGYGHFAQIGHGGISTSGNHHGDIIVEAGNDLNFTSGGETYDGNNTDHRSYALLGHGGATLTGNLGSALDQINVTAANAINFRAQPKNNLGSAVPYAAHVYVLNRPGNQDENHRNRARGDENFVMIGHGGSLVYGDKTGAINVEAGNGINFSGAVQNAAGEDGESDNGGSYNFAQIGHGGYSSYRQYRDNVLSGVTADGDNFNVPRDLDGTGLPFWPSLDSADSPGAALYDGFSGDITVTATGGDITFTGGNSHNTFAHIGHGGHESGGDHDGTIRVDAEAGSVIFNADVDVHGVNAGFAGSGNNTWTMIGHGGFYSDGEIRSDIFVDAANDIIFDGGDSASFSKIGHGGWADGGTRTDRWGGSDAAFRRANDRGYRPATRSGNITVNSGGDILFTGGNADGDQGFVQIGHGGRQVTANPNSAYGDGHSGDINVNSDGEIVFEGGERRGSFAQIGHGGYESFGNHGGDGVSDNRLDSDIEVVAQDGIVFKATGISNTDTARNFAMIGHGGWRSSYRDVQDMDSNYYAILGPYDTAATVVANNAGRNPFEPYTTNPDGLALDLATGEPINGDADFITPSGTVTAGAATLGTFMGDITVRTTGAGADIQFIGPSEAEGTIYGNSTESFVQIGHGGFRNFADIEGSVTVESAGGISFSAVQGNGTRNSNHGAAYALLGHGGYESGGEFSGNITVTSVDTITFLGGDSVDGAGVGFAQIGHGGYNSDDDQGEYTSAARDASGTVKATDNDEGNSGDITVTVSNGDLEFLAGKDSDTYVQIGHGGRSTRDTHHGDIMIDVDGGIRFIAGQDELLDTNPGGNNRAYAQIGHGGDDSDGTHYGNITVSAGSFAAGPEAGRGIVFRGGDHDETYAQLGHGGHNVRTFGTVAGGGEGLTGDINVSAAGDIHFVAGSFAKKDDPFDVGNEAQAYAQLGHGGYDVDSFLDSGRQLAAGLIGHSGDITVTTTQGDINFLAANSGYDTHAGDGGGNYHYAQLGHGGANAQGDHHGNITVRAGIDADGTVTDGTSRVLFAAGGGTTDDWADNNNYAQLGHGGRNDGNDANTSGNFGLATDMTTVMSGQDILFTSRGGVNNYVQLGNGGYNAAGDHQGNIQVYAERDFTVEGSQGNAYEASYSFVRPQADNNSYRNLDRAADFIATTQGSSRVEGEVDFMFNRVVAGTLEIRIRDDSGTQVMLVRDDGTGTNTLVVVGDTNIDVDNADNDGDANTGTEFFADGTVVGTYTGSRIQFNQDINPGADPYSGTRNIGIVYQSEMTDRSYAMVGHGGYDSDQPNGNSALGSTGNINIVARTGNIGVFGGADDDSYAQIGHGGRSTSGLNTGNIVARAGGNVNLNGGAGTRGSAQIGHGGYESHGAHTGYIAISGGTGNLLNTLGVGQFNDVGDFDLDMAPDTVQFSTATFGEVNLQGGTANDTYAMVGHGGRNTDGSVSGLINVAVDQNVNLLGNTGTRSFAQIGHGGGASDGNHSGDVSVISQDSGGTVALTVGTGSEAYALIGHGDDTNTDSNRATGTRQGAIGVFADNIERTDDSNTIAQIGHATDDNSAALNLGGTHYQVVAYTGGNETLNVNNNYYRSAIKTYMDNDVPVIIGGGNITVTTTDMNESAPFNRGLQTTFLATGSLDINRTIENTGNGAINLVAGYNDPTRSAAPINVTAGVASTTFNMNTVKSTPALYGADVTDILTVTGTTAATYVGGALADVNAAGYAVQVLGGNGTNEYARIGHRGTEGADADLWVGARDGGVLVQGGTGTQTEAQIGHGGLNLALLDPIEGNITVTTSGDVTVQAGDTGDSAWSMIGHGGQTVTGAGKGDSADTISVTADGNITVAGSTQNNGWAQIGSGGLNSSGGATAGNIEVISTGGDISILGGGNNGAFEDDGYAIIGNATTQSQSSASGDIWVSAENGTLTLSAGAGNQTWFDGTGSADTPNFAQIGHGSHENDQTLSGRIVAIAGVIDMDAGIAPESYTQIGHGGFNSDGAKAGDIFINYNPDTMAVAGGTGDITLTGGSEDRTYSKIGHGGSAAGGTETGDIYIGAAQNINMEAGDANRSYTQIGHGGEASSGNKSGWITVNAATNINIGTGAGTGTNSGAQIGHGGYNSTTGTRSGKIAVISSGGSVNVAGLSGNGTYGQIGHGGLGDDGNMDGPIYVSADDTVSITGGTGTNAYAMIGHGDGVPQGSGTRQGDLYIEAGTSITADGTNSPAVIGSLSNGGAVTNSDIAFDTPSFSTTDLTIGGSSINILETGGHTVNGDFYYNSSADLNIWAGNNLVIRANIQNQGDGDINLVAGWDGTTGFTPAVGGPNPYLDANNCPDFSVSFSAIKNDATKASWGDGTDRVDIGATSGTQEVAVGTRQGTTNVLGSQVRVLGANDTVDAYGRLGYVPVNNTDHATGDIMVWAKDSGLVVNTGNNVDGVYAQIGHGGGDLDAQLNGDIMIHLAHGTTPGSIVMASDTGLYSYSQIGHGGVGQAGEIGGLASSDILIHGDTANDAGAGLVNPNGGSGEGTISIIGHGGVESIATISQGDIVITSSDNVNMDGGTGLGAGAQIGHGGYLASNSVVDSAITITTDGTVDMDGGNSAIEGGYAQIGHGGFNVTRDAAGTALRTGYANADRFGDINIVANTNIDLVGGGSQLGYNQIGHGGVRNSAVTGHGGAINLTSQNGRLIVRGGDAGGGGVGEGAYAMVGHGGFQSAGDHGGDITVLAATSVNVEGDIGDDNDGGNRAFGQIGHGGYDGDYDSSILADVPNYSLQPIYADNRAANLTGSISVTSTEGDIIVRGQAGSVGEESYGQIGHGGYDTTGNFGTTGDVITVNAGDRVIVQGARRTADAESSHGSYAQIGHGGVVNEVSTIAGGLGAVDPNAGSSSGTGSHTGDIIVTTGNGTTLTNNGDLFLDGGLDDYSYGQIGHGGVNNGSGAGHSGDVTVSVLGNLNMRGGRTSGNYAYSQLGHGGYNADGSHSGSIDLQVGGDIIQNSANSADAHILIGHGGAEISGALGGATDSISVRAGGSIDFSPAGNRGFSMIGLGGYNVDGAHQLQSLTVTAGDPTLGSGAGVGNITMDSSSTDEFSMIGIGGRLSSGDFTIGNIDVTANGGDIIMTPAGSRGFSMIGMGGHNSIGDFTVTDEFNVSADGNIVMDSINASSTSFNLIGLGGFSSGAGGDTSADIHVNAGGDVSLIGGDGVNQFAMIGQGGIGYDGAKTGKTTVEAGGLVFMQAGTANNTFAQIGYGGVDSDGDMDGGIYVFADNGDITLTADTSTNAYSYIGHGAANGGTTGARDGDIWVQATGGGVITHSEVGNNATIGHLSDTAGGVMGGNMAVIGDFLSLDSAAGLASMLNAGADVLLAATMTDIAFNGNLFYNGSGNLDVVAGGNIFVYGSMQNSGSGDLNLIGGWDGTTGLAPVNRLVCPPVTGDFFDPTTVLDAGAYGGMVFVLGNTQAASVGSAGGTTRVAADDLGVLGSDTTDGAYAQIGYSTHTANASTSGDILLTLKNGLLVAGGDANQAEAFVGHGGGGGSLSGDITVESHFVDVRGGLGNQSFAQIGHNTTGSANGNTMVSATEDIVLRGGDGDLAFAKIGHGSTNANGDYFGNIYVSAEDGVAGSNASADPNDIKLLRGTGTDAYVQIGHGDFLHDSGKGASGSGNREGHIQLRAGSDIISEGGMIGHVDPDVSNGNSANSNVVVAVSRDQPRSILGATVLGEDVPPNDGVGRIIARDGASFAAPEGSQLRFYVPTREGVQVEAGTSINGNSFTPVAIDDPRALFETSRVQVTSNGVVIIRPQVPLFLPADQNDPFFNSFFFDDFIFYYDSLLADEPLDILNFLFNSGFNDSRDRTEDLERILDAMPESSNFKIGFRVPADDDEEGDEETNGTGPNPYSTWWMVSQGEGRSYMLELSPEGIVYVWVMNNPDSPTDSIHVDAPTDN